MRSPSSAGEKLLQPPAPRGGPRASRRAPVPTARRAQGPVAEPGCAGLGSESQRGTRHTHLTPACCGGLGSAAWAPGSRGTLPRVRSAEAHRWRRHPESQEETPPRNATVSGPRESRAHLSSHSSAPAERR
ncbi:uncharacterized protein LOC121830098 [Peromyscus maniculatus bairdii]|uniref:uncharacterized protein LOC121830098 n=1 Tax=Peromyscus maniculatus bairdii TaxID=230844 RepID=UPI003FD20783